MLEALKPLGGILLLLSISCIPISGRIGDETETLLFEDFYHLLGFDPETNYQVMKWVQPIRYEIIERNGRPSDEIVTEVHRAMLDFSYYSGIPARVSDANEIPNFKVMFQKPNFDANTFFIASDRTIGLCYADIDDGLDYRNGIPAMMIVLPNNSYDQAIKCLEHELMHAFGFWNHTPDREYKTVTSVGRVRETKASITDIFWIKALYSPEMRPGMGPEEAKQAAKQVIKRLYSEFLAYGNTFLNQ